MLAERFRGALIESGDARYDEARKLWNGAINRKPALIAQCADAYDVIAALDYATANGLEVAVRAGGHNVTGRAMNDDGVVIDLSKMKGIEIDLERRVARAEPGLTWGEYNEAVGAYGLVTPSGKISTVGVGGLALGGGIGWLARKYGMTIDNLISAQIVTADGRLLTASSIENPDLFWAIRGGGGNFGIAVSFQFRLHPLPQVYGGLVGWPLPAAKDVLRFYRDFIAASPDELTTVAVLLTTPDGQPAIGVAACYAGPVDEGELTLKPLVEFGEPVLAQLGAMPYHVLASMVDASGASHSAQWRSGNLGALTDEAIDLLVDSFAQVPTPQTVILIEQYGGAMGRIDSAATAFPHRHMTLNLCLDAGWSEQAEGYRALGWLHTLWEEIQPQLTPGVYVGFLDSEGSSRVKEAYLANYDRLAAIKAIYDPTNLFRGNQNIAPQPAAR
jgi:FAD/FMN-containing dehydrogenase